MSEREKQQDREHSCLPAGIRRLRELRAQTYREQALKLYPWICARCGREFSGKKLRELTVHHKDHNHDHNPPDGSNWELLCLYCHEYEHSKFPEADPAPVRPPAPSRKPSAIFQPFAELDKKLKK
ncbi:MAG: HNH nuclease family protein [Deltaproteobacteria bacterium]|nr:HNH nuclease family protein [Deltaproteobacteria bacterium]